MLLMVGDGPAQLGDARPRGVLVVAGTDGGDGGLGHHGRTVGVGEALAEVDGAGLDGERRHLREDRRAEPLQAGREVGQPGHAVTLRGASAVRRWEGSA